MCVRTCTCMLPACHYLHFKVDVSTPLAKFTELERIASVLSSNFTVRTYMCDEGHAMESMHAMFGLYLSSSLNFAKKHMHVTRKAHANNTRSTHERHKRHMHVKHHASA